MKRAHKERLVPVLNERDLEESFVRGVCYAYKVFGSNPNTLQYRGRPRWTINKQDTEQRPVVA